MILPLFGDYNILMKLSSGGPLVQSIHAKSSIYIIVSTTAPVPKKFLPSIGVEL